MTAFDVRSAARAKKEDAVSLARLPGLLQKWTAARDPADPAIRLPLMADWSRIRTRDTVAEITVAAYDKAPTPAKPRLLRLAARTAARAALDALVAAVDSPDPALADTAVRLLADRAEPGHLPKMMEILADPSGKRYAHALRGALAVVSKEDSGTAADRLASLKSIYEHTGSDTDRAAVLRASAVVGSWAAARWAVLKLDARSPAVRSAAADAIVAIAPRTFDKNPVETVRLVERIMKSFKKSPAVRQAAGKCHRHLMALAKKKGLLTKIITATTRESADDDLDLDL
jgi:hypothetical protein